MKLNELTTEYEQHKVFMYASDGNKVVRHNKKMRKAADNIYVGEVEEDCYGQKSFAVYLVFDGVECGVWAGSCPGWYLEEDDGVERVVNRVGNHNTVDGILSTVNSLIAESTHITLLMVEFVNQIKPELLPAMMESRRLFSERKAKENAERRAKQEAEEAEYVRVENEKADKIIDKAIEILCNGGILSNDNVTIYKGRYDSSTYSIVNYLCRKFGIKLPIRTAGWVNNSLATLIIKDGKCEQLQYYKRTKNATASNAIYGYINQLIAAAKAA